MTDISKLKQHLINHPALVEKILIECDFHNVHDLGTQFRCGWDYESRTGSSTVINKHNLWCTSFSRNVQGDIVTLVQKKLNLNFPQAVSKICSITGYEEVEEKVIEAVQVFGGIFDKFKKKEQKSEIITTYDESVLDGYLKMPNKRFLKDGIGVFTQEYYEIMYDPFTNRIAIVWRDITGKIAGIMGRLNKDEIEEYELKYLPLIPFRKSRILYGLNQNYSTINEKGVIVVGESEKMVLQMHSFGFNNAVSIGGSFISDEHKNMIHSTMPKKIILAFDEGVEEGKIVHEAEKLKAINPFMENSEIFYIYDKKNEILKADGRQSPTDLGKDAFGKLMMHNLKKV